MIGTVEWEFRRRYLLSPRDPRFLDVTLDEMAADVWAWRYSDNPKLLEAIENDDFDPDAVDELPDTFEPVGGSMIVPGVPPDDFEDLP